MGKALVDEENNHSLTPLGQGKLASAPHTVSSLGEEVGGPQPVHKYKTTGREAAPPLTLPPGSSNIRQQVGNQQAQRLPSAL